MRSHSQAGLFSEARSLLRRILRMPPTTDGGGRYDGTALLRLGGALQRLHRFAEARAVWRRGAARLPHHAELAREAAVSRAYVGGGAEVVGEGEGVGHVARPAGECAGGVGGADRRDGSGMSSRAAGRPYLECVRMSKGRCAFVTAQPLLSLEGCAAVVRACEAHAAAAGGWSTARHTTVPTTDLEVHAVPAALRWFNVACQQTIFPLLEACYGALGVRASSIRVSDAFVVRYDAAAQASLPVHAVRSRRENRTALLGV